MGKKKATKYLPLFWTEALAKQLYAVCPNVSVEDLRIIVGQGTPNEIRHKTLAKYPPLYNMISMLSDRADEDKETEHILKETLRDFDSISLTMLWAKNKQVFAFDKDFTNELLRTDTINLVRNGWDYLPYQCFYVDLSDNKELCQKILGDGMFISLEKMTDSRGEVYCVHVCKVSGEYFYNDVFSFINEDRKCPVSEIQVDSKVVHYNHMTGVSHKEIDGVAYEVIVAQILTYLSSVEPDIRENPNTKQTYRKPAPNAAPKNKFSEIQSWDVGVRFGNSFRAWKKEKAQSGERRGGGNTSGTKQRPHCRRAHWSHYWYGSGEDKVCRPKWVSEYYVGMKGEEKPAVIHKVKS